MKFPVYILIIATSLYFIGCSPQTTGDNSPIIAKANKHSLTLEQLKKNVPEGLTKEDSTLFAKKFISSWARNKIIYDKAVLNLSDEQIDIDERVNEYRQSLYIHKYEQRLINHNLDKTIDTLSIQQFYNAHKGEFLLKNDIVKSNYIKVDKNVGNDTKVKKWLQSRKEEDLDHLKDFGFQFATKFSFSEEWLDADFVFEQMPRDFTNRQGIMKYKILTTASDSLFNYYLLITDYRTKSDTAPLPYVQNTIEEILLQQKKRNLLTQTRNKLYEDALNKNEVVLTEAQ